ncbi:hypothetical protein [Burkholderia sola]|uniref:hypothetical protein n=1 Tax=Burkholderia sola TaxID=2843302 RepID=UPI0023DD9FF3|nr:hypothetical protein [Burkholderia sola]MDF3079717.1 hypothetical protein [Burkholderia sola]
MREHPVEFLASRAVFGPRAWLIPARRAKSFPMAALQRIPCGDRTASAWPAPRIVSPPFAPSPDFFAHEIPVQETDLTTVIVRRRIGRFFTS